MLPVRRPLLPRTGRSSGWSSCRSTRPTRSSSGASGSRVLLWLTRWETGREVAVIFGFHLVGLALELFKVRQGSWSYPDTGMGVGRRGAAVQRFHVRGRRQLHLPGMAPVRSADHRLPGPQDGARRGARLPELLHVAPDLGPAAAARLRSSCSATWRTWVHFTVGARRYAMPLALSFGLIGFFLWAAENVATLGRAWQYPSQESVWTLVHPAKVVRGCCSSSSASSWSRPSQRLYEGRLYGTPADLTVLRAGRRGAVRSGRSDGRGEQLPLRRGRPSSRWLPRGVKRKPDPRHHVADRAGHEHLLVARERQHPSRDVHGDAADVVAVQLDLAGVQPGPDRQARLRELVADRGGRADARAGPSNVARKPSPVVSISRPRNRARFARTTRRARRAAGAIAGRRAPRPGPSSRRCR